MEFAQKREISRRIADPLKIEIYRSLLQARRVPSSGMRGDDKRKLATELVFTALSYYSEEDILSACSSASGASVQPETKAFGLQKKNRADAPAAQGGASDPQPHKKASKFEEYPKIRWQDLDNPLIRTADAIFSDRINLHQALRAMEPTLDQPQIDTDTLAVFIEKSIRMELCFRELKTFNDKGDFYGRHPFITQRTERERLQDLLRTDPSKFLDEMKNVEANISRYRSHAKSAKLSAEKRAKESENLLKYEAIKKMYQEILENNIKR